MYLFKQLREDLEPGTSLPPVDSRHIFVRVPVFGFDGKSSAQAVGNKNMAAPIHKAAEKVC